MTAPPGIRRAARRWRRVSRTATRFQRRHGLLQHRQDGRRTGAPAFPSRLTRELMQRGQQRFNINCAVCHGLTAAGNGIAKQYGLSTVVTLQDERIRNMADGEIFNTITNGKNTMMAYGGTCRWRIGGRSLLICAPCSAARTPPLLMCRRKNWQNWKRRRPNRRSPNLQPARRRQRNERAFPRRAGAGRRVFRNKSVQRFVLAAGGRRCCRALALPDRRVHRSPLQFSFSWLFGFIYFLHPLLRLFVLDHRASRDRRGMVGRSAAAARKYRAASLRSALFLRSRSCCSAIIFLSG